MAGVDRLRLGINAKSAVATLACGPAFLSVVRRARQPEKPLSDSKREVADLASAKQGRLS